MSTQVLPEIVFKSPKVRVSWQIERHKVNLRIQFLLWHTPVDMLNRLWVIEGPIWWKGRPEKTLDSARCPIQECIIRCAHLQDTTELDLRGENGKILHEFWYWEHLSEWPAKWRTEHRKANRPCSRKTIMSNLALISDAFMIGEWQSTFQSKLVPEFTSCSLRTIASTIKDNISCEIWSSFSSSTSTPAFSRMTTLFLVRKRICKYVKRVLSRKSRSKGDWSSYGRRLFSSFRWSGNEVQRLSARVYIALSRC